MNTSVPNVIPQPCAEEGCQVLVPRGRCQRHQRRPPSRRVYDVTWERLRREHLKREPRCRACGKPATVL